MIRKIVAVAFLIHLFLTFARAGCGDLSRLDKFKLPLDPTELSKIISIDAKGEYATLGQWILQRASPSIQEVFKGAKITPAALAIRDPISLDLPAWKKIAAERFRRNPTPQQKRETRLQGRLASYGEFKDDNSDDNSNDMLSEIEIGSESGKDWVEGVKAYCLYLVTVVRLGNVRFVLEKRMGGAGDYIPGFDL